MKKTTYLFLSLILLISSCTKPAEKEIGFGSYDGDRYTNDYFGLAIDFPSGWSKQSQDGLNEIKESGEAILAGEDKNLKAAIRAAELQTVNLFAVFKYLPGSPVDSNPSIMCVAERIKNQPGITKGGDYLFHVRKLLSSTQISYEFPREIYSTSISGKEFEVLEAELKLGSVRVKQHYYAIKLKDYALGIILSYISDSEKEELDKVLNTLTFSE